MASRRQNAFRSRLYGPNGVPPRRRASRAAAAQHRGDAGGELGQLDRLAQVVVGADLEPDHPVDEVAGAGQDHDAGVEPAAQRPRQLEPVLPRQAEVEHEEVRAGAAGQERLERHAVGGGEHLVPGLAEKVDEHLADVPLVVDDGDARHVQPPATLL